jgi:hypothetical protein
MAGEEAEKIAMLRLEAAGEETSPRRDDLLLDLLIERIELADEGFPAFAAKARETVGAFEQGWRRELASAAIEAVAGHGAVRVPSAPNDAPARWKLLADVLALKTDDQTAVLAVCARCGDAEPELRRWAASKLVHAARPWLHDLRRRADAASAKEIADGLRADEILLSVEPHAGVTEVSWTSKQGGGVREVPGDALLRDFYVAAVFEPARLEAAAKALGDSVFASAAGADATVRRLVLSVPEPYVPLPYDMVPFGDGRLIDRFEVVVVSSATELLRARARPAPPILAQLPSPFSTLDGRYAVVRPPECDVKDRARFFALTGAAQNAGKDASAAVREAKLTMRKEWTPDPAKPVVPPWATFLLRGAP